MAFEVDKRHIYTPSKTGELFLADRTHRVKGIMGPVGSGKSVTCIVDLVLLGTEQAPDRNGVRWSRWAIIRNTYAELESTTIKTFEEWVPPQCCHISSRAPFVGRLWGNHEDGKTTFEIEFIFIALDRPDQCKKLLSLEYTGAWINEAREIPESIFRHVLSRCGRYPRKSVAPISWYGIIMDTNPPDTDSWYYKLAEQIKDPKYAFYRQPAALIDRGNGVYEPNPEAENVENLPAGYDYYFQNVGQGCDPNFIRVMVLAEYGSVGHDKPVYECFNVSLHASKPLTFERNRELLLMFDFGLTPVCLFGQIINGQLRIYDERCFEYGGIRQFVRGEVIPLLNEKYKNIPFRAVCDPAGNQRQQVDDTLTCIGELKRLGIPAEAAQTNQTQQRIQAVTDLLTQLTPKAEPALVIDPACKKLIKGFISGYYYKRVGRDGLFKDEPTKNEYSHPHDALQYGALQVVMPQRKKENEAARGKFGGMNTASNRQVTNYSGYQ